MDVDVEVEVDGADGKIVVEFVDVLSVVVEVVVVTDATQ